MSGLSGRAVAALATVAVACSVAGRTEARPSPVAVTPHSYRAQVTDVLRACRVAVRDLQPFVFVVLVLRPADPPDQLMALVHEVVGSAVMLSTGRGTDTTMDGHVALIVADTGDAIAELLDDVGRAFWDPMSHYYWLVADAKGKGARSLFRAAWRRWSLVNVVIVARSGAYTYNPFNDTLTVRPVDAGVLRDVNRHNMDDLHGHPVRICMFPSRLSSVLLPDGSYAGIDGVVASTAAKYMNFTPVYSTPSDGFKYGWAENISDTQFKYTGLLGDLVHNKVDMTFNSVFLKPYHHNNTIRYTVPVMFDELCFVAPMAQQMSQWRAVFTAFDVRLWYCLAATFVVALSTWTLIKGTIHEPFNVDLLALHLFQMFLMVPLNRVPKNVPERLLVVSVVLFGFITATSLQAVMVKYLHYPKYEQNMATVQQVYDSGMSILSASNNLIMMFESDDDDLYVKLSDRFVFNKHIDLLTEVAQKRSSVAVGRKNELVEKIAGSYVDADNNVLLHIVDACPQSFHFVYLIRRDVPYVNAINRVITAFVESGIINSWHMRAKPVRPLSDYHQPKHSHDVFAMKNVVIAFMFLVVGLAVSGVVFVAEVVHSSHWFAGPEVAPPLIRYPRRPLRVRRF